MASNRDFADEVVGRLTPLGPVSWRRMFGGFGIYLDGVMFGLIAYDTLYFKIDDQNRPDYEQAGSQPFTYEGKRKPVEMSYWRVPDDVFGDIEAFAAWGEKAHAAARRAKAKKAPKRRR